MKKYKIKFKKYSYSDWEIEERETDSLYVLIYTLDRQYHTYKFDLSTEIKI